MSEYVAPQSELASIDMEAALLQHCPRCGYCIRGLPIHHRCPECGFDVDRRWEVFGGRFAKREPLRGFLRAEWMILLVLGMNIFSLCLAVFGTRAPMFVPVRVGLLAIFVAMIVFVVVRRPRGFIIVGDDGVAMHRRKKRIFWSWQDFRRAQISFGGKSIELQRSGASQFIHTRPFFGYAIAEAERCAQAINERRIAILGEQ